MGTERFRGALLATLVIASIIALAIPLLSPSLVHAASTASIYIEGNYNFTLANGVTSGSGTENDPYIIENWDISAKNANGIEIKNTDAYFVIRNCYVHDGKGLYYGIFLSNVKNGIVDNNTVEKNRFGIRVENNSNNNLVENNTVENNRYRGIYLSYSYNNLISNNLVEKNHFCGISLYYSDNNLVENNLVENNDGDGIYLSYSYNNLVENNTVENNRHDGIGLFYSYNNLVENNTVENNDYYGIYLYGSDNNLIYHNNFINNVKQAFDQGTNYWDNGYPSGGNYWSDYTGVDSYRGEDQNLSGSDRIGDTPYYIPGDNNRDRYPLVPPAEVRVGVKAGDWVKLDYTVSGAPSGTNLPRWIKLEFLSVEGTSANVRVTMHMADGTEESQTMAVDVAAGGGTFGGLSGFVIPANTKAGDSIDITGYGDVTIAGETTRTYAGASRTVVHASISQYGTQLTYYWDKQTGVMVGASAVSGDMTGTAKATETNMWQAGPPAPTRWPLIAGIVGIIVIIGIVAALYMRRRKPREAMFGS